MRRSSSPSRMIAYCNRFYPGTADMKRSSPAAGKPAPRKSGVRRPGARDGDPPAGALPLGRRVAAVRPMRLRPGQRRKEDADQLEVAARCPQDMLVVLVERVDRAGPDRKGPSGRHLDDLALAADAVVRLEMVLV